MDFYEDILRARRFTPEDLPLGAADHEDTRTRGTHEEDPAKGGTFRNVVYPEERRDAESF